VKVGHVLTFLVRLSMLKISLIGARLLVERSFVVIAFRRMLLRE
jgi:hypothetical protein